MKSTVKNTLKGVYEIIFPHVCAVCGGALPDQSKHICRPCLLNKFERVVYTANGLADQDVLLPENVGFQFAMWRFDKGGYLQELLHQLKYHRLTGIGEDLGAELGRRLTSYSRFQELENSVLIPVPLHQKKEQKRGFNQAASIARGVHKVLEMEYANEHAVVRRKHTKTQTGFSLEDRRKNVRSAFEVKNSEEFLNRSCLLIDDVFTTGATTFELADVLLQSGARKIFIATVAMA